MAVREAGIQPDFIAPTNLIGLVRSTAPFLFDRIPACWPGGRLIEAGREPFGFLTVLSAAEWLESADLTPEEWREDYFAFCLACHHATVATFVPTDVDSKIRGLLWRGNRDRESLGRMFRFTRAAMEWSLEGISKRATALAGAGPVSGHNGEQLSVLAGALGAFLHAGLREEAEDAAGVIEHELAREATGFRYALATPGFELEGLRLAASLTHNAGDLDQGISFWPKAATHAPYRERFARLAHENVKAFGGTFQLAAALYRKAMSCEGHRHYPLRAVKPLRQSPDFLLPLGPFLDDWGAVVAIHPALDRQARADTMAALLTGCRTIPGQRGYYRALHGMMEALGGNVEAVVSAMTSRGKADWKSAEVRKQVAVPRPSFESMMRKMLSGVSVR